MNADFILSISRKDTDKLNNTARFHVMKNRFGQDGMTFQSKMDTNKGIIEVYEKTANAPSTNGASGGPNSGQDIARKLLQQKYTSTIDLG